jgi:hypothetical protein
MWLDGCIRPGLFSALCATFADSAIIEDLIINLPD